MASGADIGSIIAGLIPQFFGGLSQSHMNDWLKAMSINKLNAAANEALKDPQLRELMLAQGNEIGGGSPAEFAALVKSEASKWSAVVKSANIKPE